MTNDGAVLSSLINGADRTAIRVPTPAAGDRPAILDLRNYGVMAHIDAGKTTISERILFYSGRIHRTGEVHDGEATLDYMEEERQRGITITSAATQCSWRGVRMNLIDTPGHVDFTAEVERSLRVLDGAICVFDGGNGVEPQSETVWRQADRYRVPRLCFVNKMDRVGASFQMSVDSIVTKLGARAIPLQLPIGEEKEFRGIIDLVEQVAVYHDEASDGRLFVEEPVPEELCDTTHEARQKLIEAVADHDEDVLTLFLEGGEVPAELLHRAIRRATVGGTVFPVLLGSALKNRGIQQLLDAVCRYLPSPIEAHPISGRTRGGEEVIRQPQDGEPLSGLAFKTIADKNGDLTFVRVYSGSLRRGEEVYNSTRRKRERIGRVLLMHANEREEVTALGAGQIGAVLGLKETVTGDTLCERSSEILLESIRFPETVLALSVAPRSRADRDKLAEALSRLAKEDPTFHHRTDDETSETVIAGMGELHLEILVSRLRREYGIQVDVGAPRVAYRQTLARAVDAEGRHIKQSGGRGQYGVARIRVAPIPEPVIEFVDDVRGGTIPREYIPAVEDGIRRAAQEGGKLGFPFLNLRITLHDGQYHEVDSSEIAFQTAGWLAFRNAVEASGAVLLEPKMRFEARAPEQYISDVLGSLNARRAEIESLEAGSGDVKVVKGRVPLAEMFNYTTVLRSATQGRGAYTMEPCEYTPAPREVSERVRREVEQRKAEGNGRS